MTKHEILLCVYEYLDTKYTEDPDKSAEYIFFISNLNPSIWEDKGTADPAYYADFLEIISSFFHGTECSLQDGLNYAKRYLEEYNRYEIAEYSSNIDEVVRVFDSCSIQDWEGIYKRMHSQ